MVAQPASSSGGAHAAAAETQLGDLPEECLAQAIALTSPRDACRIAAVSPAFRAAADSDHVWQRFIPTDGHFLLFPAAANNKEKKKKDAYLGLCDAAGAAAVGGDGGGGRIRVWLERATGARCYALSARRLSLPWDDGEFCWKFTPDPRSRFGEVAELVDCTCLDIYGTLPSSSLTPATSYAAYFVYGAAAAPAEGAAGHRGLSYPDQETTVSIGGRVVDRHDVCLLPPDGGAAVVAGGGRRRPRRREDGWWEMEMGRLVISAAGGETEEQEVTASFEVLGWHPKRGLLVEGIEFRPVVAAHTSTT